MISLRGNPGLPRKKKANGLLLNRECVVGKSGDGFTLLRNATTVCSDLSKMCFGMTSPILALSCAAQARGTTQQTAQEGCHSPWPQGPKKWRSRMDRMLTSARKVRYRRYCISFVRDVDLTRMLVERRSVGRCC